MFLSVFGSRLALYCAHMGSCVSVGLWLKVGFILCTHGILCFCRSLAQGWLYIVHTWDLVFLSVFGSRLTLYCAHMESCVSVCFRLNVDFILSTHGILCFCRSLAQGWLYIVHTWNLVFLSVFGSRLALYCAHMESCVSVGLWLKVGFILCAHGILCFCRSLAQGWLYIVHTWDLVFLSVFGSMLALYCAHMGSCVSVCLWLNVDFI